MICHSEYWVIIAHFECGPAALKLIDIHRQTGSVERGAYAGFKIKCASELDQRSTFDAFEKAIDTDLPPDCDYCGNHANECDCDDEDADTAERADSVHFDSDRERES